MLYRNKEVANIIIYLGQSWCYFYMSDVYSSFEHQFQKPIYDEHLSESKINEGKKAHQLSANFMETRLIVKCAVRYIG